MNFILGQKQAMNGTEVRGQTRPGVAKRPWKTLAGAEFMRTLPGVSSFRHSPVPTVTPMAYADQLTSRFTTLQSPIHRHPAVQSNEVYPPI
ncbi:MAG: hypothetical protein LWW81_16700 [Rhodocyclales bacterium]|nr:hypothetical protein [Rhodocyclales bacterium]